MDRTRISPVEVTVLFTAFVAASYAFGVYLFSALIPDIRKALNIGQSAVGFISSAGQTGNMTFAILSSLLIRRLGAIRCVFLFLTITVACQITFAFLQNEWSMVSTVFMLGGCASAVWVSIVVASQTLIAETHRSKALGLMSSGTSFGLCVNGLILPALIARGGWPLPWLVLASTTTAILGLAIWRLWSFSDLSGVSVPLVRTTAARSRGSVAAPPAVFAMILLFGTSLCLVPFQTYLSSMLRDGFSWSTEYTSRAWSVMGLGGMFGGATLGTIADRISIRRTLVATFVILAIAIPMPLFFFTCTMLVYLVILIFGMCYFALFGLIAAYLTKMFPPREASILSGTTFVAVGLGSAIGNFAGGRIIELTGGFSVLYIGIAFLSGTLALVASLTPADRRPLQCARHR